jgi:predicted HTH transcriptional regulator
MMGEGTQVDFKRDPYKLADATEDEKGALLKDILSFANAERDGDAFILLGVGQDGSTPIVLGIASHINDAHLQQFVAGTVVGPSALRLSYVPFVSEGKALAAIRIPRQVRPFYSRRDLGREVKKEVVYFRRGSSTAVATHLDVAEMGRTDALAQASAAVPALRIKFANVRAALPRRSSESVDATHHANANGEPSDGSTR